MSLTLFDIVILTIITASSMLGMYKGFIKISISLIGFICSIVLTIFLYPLAKDLLGEYLSNNIIMSVAGSILSYLLSLIIFSFLTSRLSNAVEPISGGIIDRFFGLFVGFLRGFAISLLTFLLPAIFTSGSYIGAVTMEDVIYNMKEDKYAGWLTKSLTSKYLDNALRNLTLMLPKHTLKSIKLPEHDITKESTDILIEKASHHDLDKTSHIQNEDLKRELDELLK